MNLTVRCRVMTLAQVRGLRDCSLSVPAPEAMLPFVVNPSRVYCVTVWRAEDRPWTVRGFPLDGRHVETLYGPVVGSIPIGG